MGKKIITVGNVPHKWMKLMLYFCNAVPVVHHCVFPDSKSARYAADHMRKQSDQHPEWFPVTIIQRGVDMWVIKNKDIQEVVIVDE